MKRAKYVKYLKILSIPPAGGEREGTDIKIESREGCGGLRRVGVKAPEGGRGGG